MLLGYQPLTDGICDDVLDVVEDIAGETVIELTQEEQGIEEGKNWKIYTHLSLLIQCVEIFPV